MFKNDELNLPWKIQFDEFLDIHFNVPWIYDTNTSRQTVASCTHIKLKPILYTLCWLCVCAVYLYILLHIYMFGIRSKPLVGTLRAISLHCLRVFSACLSVCLSVCLPGQSSILFAISILCKMKIVVSHSYSAAAACGCIKIFVMNCAWVCLRNCCKRDHNKWTTVVLRMRVCVCVCEWMGQWDNGMKMQMQWEIQQLHGNVRSMIGRHTLCDGPGFDEF